VSYHTLITYLKEPERDSGADSAKPGDSRSEAVDAMPPSEIVGDEKILDAVG
jgi:hypothetical protein